MLKATYLAAAVTNTMATHPMLSGADDGGTRWNGQQQQQEGSRPSAWQQRLNGLGDGFGLASGGPLRQRLADATQGMVQRKDDAVERARSWLRG